MANNFTERENYILSNSVNIGWFLEAIDKNNPLHPEEGAAHTESYELDGQNILVPRVRIKDGKAILNKENALEEALEKGDYIVVPEGEDPDQYSKDLSKLIGKFRGFNEGGLMSRKTSDLTEEELREIDRLIEEEDRVTISDLAKSVAKIGLANFQSGLMKLGVYTDPKLGSDIEEDLKSKGSKIKGFLNYLINPQGHFSEGGLMSRPMLPSADNDMATEPPKKGILGDTVLEYAREPFAEAKESFMSAGRIETSDDESQIMKALRPVRRAGDYVGDMTMAALQAGEAGYGVFSGAIGELFGGKDPEDEKRLARDIMAMPEAFIAATGAKSLTQLDDAVDTGVDSIQAAYNRYKRYVEENFDTSGGTAYSFSGMLPINYKTKFGEKSTSDRTQNFLDRKTTSMFQPYQLIVQANPPLPKDLKDYNMGNFQGAIDTESYFTDPVLPAYLKISLLEDFPKKGMLGKDLITKLNKMNVPKNLIPDDLIDPDKRYSMSDLEFLRNRKFKIESTTRYREDIQKQKDNLDFGYTDKNLANFTAKVNYDPGYSEPNKKLRFGAAGNNVFDPNTLFHVRGGLFQKYSYGFEDTKRLDKILFRDQDPDEVLSWTPQELSQKAPNYILVDEIQSKFLNPRYGAGAILPLKNPKTNKPYKNEEEVISVARDNLHETLTNNPFIDIVIEDNGNYPFLTALQKVKAKSSDIDKVILEKYSYLNNTKRERLEILESDLDHAERNFASNPNLQKQGKIDELKNEISKIRQEIIKAPKSWYNDYQNVLMGAYNFRKSLNEDSEEFKEYLKNNDITGSGVTTERYKNRSLEVQALIQKDFIIEQINKYFPTTDPDRKFLTDRGLPYDQVLEQLALQVHPAGLFKSNYDGWFDQGLEPVADYLTRKMLDQYTDILVSELPAFKNFQGKFLMHRQIGAPHPNTGETGPTYIDYLKLKNQSLSEQSNKQTEITDENFDKFFNLPDDDVEDLDFLTREELENHELIYDAASALNVDPLDLNDMSDTELVDLIRTYEATQRQERMNLSNVTDSSDFRALEVLDDYSPTRFTAEELAQFENESYQSIFALDDYAFKDLQAYQSRLRVHQQHLENIKRGEKVDVNTNWYLNFGDPLNFTDKPLDYSPTKEELSLLIQDSKDKINLLRREADENFYRSVVSNLSSAMEDFPKEISLAVSEVKDKKDFVKAPISKNQEITDNALKVLIQKADNTNSDFIIIPSLDAILLAGRKTSPMLRMLKDFKIAQAKHKKKLGSTYDVSTGHAAYLQQSIDSIENSQFYRLYKKSLDATVNDLERNFADYVTVHRDVPLPYGDKANIYKRDDSFGAEFTGTVIDIKKLRENFDLDQPRFGGTIRSREQDAQDMGYTKEVFHTTTAKGGKPEDDVLDNRKSKNYNDMFDALGTHVGTRSAAQARLDAQTRDMLDSRNYYGDAPGDDNFNDLDDAYLGRFMRENPEFEFPTMMRLKGKLNKPLQGEEFGLGYKENGKFQPPSELQVRDFLNKERMEVMKDLINEGNSAESVRAMSNMEIVDIIKERLVSQGYTHIPYINEVEDAGSVSFIVLKPELLRDAGAARFNPRDKDKPGLGRYQGGLV